MSFDLMSLITFAYDILISLKHLSHSIIDFMFSEVDLFGQSVEVIYILFGGGLITFLAIKIGAELIS